MNNHKKWLARTLCMAMLWGAAQAEISFDGSVVASEVYAVTATIGGDIASVNVREGAWVNAGDAIASVETAKVFSPVDGTVRGIAAEPGDSAESAVFYIAPVSKYTVKASISKAYSSTSTKYVRIGETVYIRCSADGTHRAVGRITSVDGSDYTVEVTGGELYMEETVYLYREQSYKTASRIGSGTVSRAPEIEVRGTGVLVNLAVSEGEEVERGQFLFETTQSASGEGLPASSQITSSISGVVAAVSAIAGQRIESGEAVMTVYPREGFRIELSVSEDDLGSIAVGDAMRIRFAADEDGTRTCGGTISEISYLGETSESGEVVYKAYADFEAAEDVRLGMTVVATHADGE